MRRCHDRYAPDGGQCRVGSAFRNGSSHWRTERPLDAPSHLPERDTAHMLRPMPPHHDSLPTFIEPQLSLLVKTAPSGPGWAHELKYDGYRIHARLARGQVRLLTRTGLEGADRHAVTARALSAEAWFHNSDLAFSQL